jgi:hypothetical protein
MDSDSRRIQNSKESGIRTVEKSLSSRNMLEGEQLMSKPKGKPLALYKKHNGTLWKAYFSKDGNQVIDKDLEVKGSLTIDKNLIIDGTVVSKGLFSVYATDDTSDFIAKFLDSSGNGVAGFYQDSDGDGTLYIWDKSNNVDVLLRAQDGSYFNNRVTIGSTTAYSNADLTLDRGGYLMIKETSTPTADANYGKLYTKNDNKLYFQDGAGNEREVELVAL